MPMSMGRAPPSSPSADECVQAGMYWFGKREYAAARAWWERAVELEPDHVRAIECLRLVARAVGAHATEAALAAPVESNDRDPNVPQHDARENTEPVRVLRGFREPIVEKFTTAPVDPMWSSLEEEAEAELHSPASIQDPWAEVSEPHTERQVVPEALRAGLDSPVAEPFRSPDGPTDASELEDISFEAPVELHTNEPRSSHDAHSLESARQRLQLHDFEGALLILDGLRKGPLAQEANRLAEHCETQLLAMFESKLGDLYRIPELNVSTEEVIWLNLDHRAGFVLSQIDGLLTYEDLLTLSTMSRLETLRILCDLLHQGVIR